LKNISKKIKQVLNYEQTIFILIWIVLLLLPFITNESRPFQKAGVLYVATRLNLIILSVLNNFWLLPELIQKGRYGYYFIIIAILILLFSINEEFVIEQLFAADSSRSSWSMRGFYFASVRASFILLIFSCYKLLWDYQMKLTKIKNLEKERIESELKFLKAQVNPHVLFNNLNNIYSLALEHSKQVPAMILKLSEMMRYMLYDCNDKYVPLEKEIVYLKDFIELQRLRLEESAMVSFNVEGKIEGKWISPLLLITFVENSFKHSMDSTPEHVEIIIRIEVEEETLHFHTANTYSQDEIDRYKKSGIGLQNVKKRLELIYGDNYNLKIYPEDSYYHVTLDLKLNSQGEA